MRVLEDNITSVMDDITETVAVIDTYLKQDYVISNPLLYSMYVSVQDDLLNLYCEISFLWGRESE